jgi:putative ATPase
MIYLKIPFICPMSIPLAERMRPKSFDDYLGQDHLVGKGSVLRKAIESGLMPSMILWGPPGVGKTTLAGIMANTLKRNFYNLSAINSGIKDIREVIEKAEKSKFFGASGAILFIDEIHRFNKTQQDALLGAVEKGVITLVGATTENPSFEVNGALLSRCQVYVLKSLDEQVLLTLAEKAIKEDEELKNKKISILESEALIRFSGGDARRLHNVLEIAIGFLAENKSIEITDENVTQAIQQNIALYDKSGEQHYDIISAFIKSIRGSDPNAAVYWLARMLEGGEDIIFIARRLVILAAEDIGLANPNALLMANTCMDAIHKIGMPEGRIILSQAVIYLATSAKSNSGYMAIESALEMVRKEGALSVPLHLRNAPTKLMKKLDYGKDYAYAHSFENNFVNLEFLPEKISGTVFFHPSNNENEKKIKQFLETRWGDKYKP